MSGVAELPWVGEVFCPEPNDIMAVAGTEFKIELNTVR